MTPPHLEHMKAHRKEEMLRQPDLNLIEHFILTSITIQACVEFPPSCIKGDLAACGDQETMLFPPPFN